MSAAPFLWAVLAAIAAVALVIAYLWRVSGGDLHGLAARLNALASRGERYERVESEHWGDDESHPDDCAGCAALERENEEIERELKTLPRGLYVIGALAAGARWFTHGRTRGN